jgi:hypothetical protein
MMEREHNLLRSSSCLILLFVYFIGISGSPAAAQDAPAPDTGNIVSDVLKHIQNNDDSSIAPTSPASTDAQNSPAPLTPAPGIPGIVAEGDNATLPQVPEPPPSFEDHKTVILRALDKVTARTQTFEVPVGQQFNFGALTIAVRACRARPPLEPADAAAFLQIVEQKPGEPLVARFSGWMFASKPSLSALEHPVYDVWVVGCGDKAS